MSSNVVSQPVPVPASAPAQLSLPGIRSALFVREFSRLYQLRDDRDRSLADSETGLSGLACALWDTYTPEEKEQWRDCAKDASERHAVLVPDYKYEPERDWEKEVLASKPWAMMPPKWKRGKKEETAEPSKGWRMVPSSEELGGVNEPVVPPFKVSPIAFDLIRPHMLSSPIMLPPHSLPKFTPAQAAIFAGWSWESAQASTIVRAPEQFIGPYDMTEGVCSSLEAQFGVSPPPQDDYSNIAPGVDELDPFLKDPEDQEDSDMNLPKPIVSHFANLGTFKFT